MPSTAYWTNGSETRSGEGGLSSPPAALTFVTEGGTWNGLEVV